MKSKTIKKLAILLIIAVVVIIFKIFNLGAYFDLQYLKDSKTAFETLYESRPFTVIGVYFLIYVIVTSLSLPGAAIMTLAGGLLFGFVWGSLVVSFSSAIGATLACLVSRFVLRDWVQAKFGTKLEKINKGIEKEGLFYLFTLRLIPVFPFWLINLTMGITKIKLRDFYWVSQLGMLPGTMVYVNAGNQLSKIDSLSGILSPGLIISFVILGLFPLAAKKVINLYKRRAGAKHK